MHRDVISMVPGRQKLFPVLENVCANHEMRRFNFVFRQKFNECISVLQRNSKDFPCIVLSRLTGCGPSSKELAKYPSGAFQMLVEFCMHL